MIYGFQLKSAFRCQADKVREGFDNVMGSFIFVDDYTILVSLRRPLSYPVTSTWKCSAEKEIEGVDFDSL